MRKVIFIVVMLIAVLYADEIESLYNRGYAAYKAGKTQRALTLFEQILTKNKEHHLSDNANLWIGDIYLTQAIEYDSLGDSTSLIKAREAYNKALEHFKRVLTYKDDKTPKIAAAKFKIGQTYFYMGQYEKAELELVKFIALHPTSGLVNPAEEYLYELRKIREESQTQPTVSDTTSPSSGRGTSRISE